MSKEIQRTYTHQLKLSDEVVAIARAMLKTAPPGWTLSDILEAGVYMMRDVDEADAREHETILTLEGGGIFEPVPYPDE